MPVFDIYMSRSMGISHSGEITTDGIGTVELTDEEVRYLVSLIKENDGEADVKKIGLKEKFPAIYKTLEEACRELGYHEAYVYWVIAGYDGNMVEYDIEDAIATAEEHYGFHFEFDEAAYRKEKELEPEDEIDDWEIDLLRNNAFYDWVDEYRRPLNDEADAEFLECVFDICPEVDDYDYEVVIPEAIVKAAKSELGG